MHNESIDPYWITVNLYIYKKKKQKRKSTKNLRDLWIHKKTAVKNGGWVEEQCSCKRVLYMTV